MKTYQNNQEITGKEANELVSTHGYCFAHCCGSMVSESDTETGKFFSDGEAVTIVAGCVSVELRVESERFAVCLNNTAKSYPSGEMLFDGFVYQGVWSIEA